MKRINRLFSLITIPIFALLAGSCGNLLSDPPATKSITITAPTEAPTYNSATLSWSSDTECVYSVEYGTTAGTYTNATPKSTTPAVSHVATVYSLSQSTTYYYRIISYYGGVQPFPSGEYNFTTGVTPAFAIATGPTVTPAQTSLGIVWTTNATARHLIEYDTNSGVPYAYSTIISAASDTNHNVTLTGLSAGTTYYYRIRLFWDGDADTVTAEYPAVATTAEPTPTLAQKIRGIWMVGGLSAGTVGTAIAQIDLFDPVMPAWYQNVTALPTPVSFGAAVGYTRSSDGHHLIVVIGGFNTAGDTQSIVQIYDVDNGPNGTWSSGTSMTQARANIYATLLYDKIYILGGSGAAAATTATTLWAGNTTTYEYTIGSTWNTRVAFGAANTDRFSYAYGDVVYNLLGRNGGATFAASAHDGISVTANALTTGVELVIPAGPPNSPRAGVAGAVWRQSTGPSYLVLIGGYTVMTGSNQYFIPNNVTVSTPQNWAYALAYPFAAPSTWVALTNFSQAIGFGAAAIYGNTIYHFGGTTSLIPASASGDATVRYANLTAMPGVTWSSVGPISPMPVGRYGHSAVTFPQ
jgi:hypothetical protein